MRRGDDLPRAQRNAVAEVILGALRDEDGRRVLAALARVAATAAPVVLDGRAAAQLRARGLVTVGAGRRSGAEAVLAPAVARCRDALATRVDNACAAAERYWRDASAHASDAADRPDDLASVLRRAVALFAAGLYFEVHEELEPQWRRMSGADRVALQGVIQIAVALHHAERDNIAGARRLMAAGRAKIEPHVPIWNGIAIDTLLGDLHEWERTRLDAGRSAAAPRLIFA